MNTPALLAPASALLLAAACFQTSSFAGEETVPLERYEREERRVYREELPEYRPEPRTVYIVIRERPARRVVYAAPPDAYCRIDRAPRIIAPQPCYTPYPPRYRSAGYHARIAPRHCY